MSHGLLTGWLQGLIVGVGVLCAIPAYAQNSPKKPDAPDKKALPEKFVVADGTPEKLLAGIKALQDLDEPKDADEKGLYEFLVNQQLGVIAAAEKLLAKQPTEKIGAEAATILMAAWTNLVDLDYPEAGPQALLAISKLEKHPQAEVAKQARSTVVSLKMALFATLSAIDQVELTEQILAEVKSQKFSEEALGQAMTFAQILEDQEEHAVAIKYYDRLIPMLAEAKQPELEKLVNEHIIPTVRRLKLPGQPLKVEGVTLQGDKLDWDNYKGKVVLVEFWATWCGPCVAEIPHVKELYEAHHEAGFEVIGISLDGSKSTLTKFLKKNKLPWAILFDPQQTKEGKSHPLAEYYGVNALPTCLLVDREGKVVSLNARGEKLDELLGKYFEKKKGE